ncbi:MAG: DUF2497 domain-containing protein [Hyphomonas sp.]|uniref:DUF2497 domain-containing protein n=1 Tax=Hyphomonas sp. TaxID=87 RepID=UPI0034A080AF
MANEAHKEPTMEEILASIRKIISDDEPVPARAPGSVLRGAAPEPVNDYQDIEDAVAGDMHVESESMFEAELEVEETPAPAPVSTKLTGPEFTFEEVLGSARQTAGQASAEPAPPPVEAALRTPPARPSFTATEPPMQTSARYAQTVLTDEATADVAAGALGKLISRMEVSGDNTIEGLVKEMLKPMIKEWLDANLANIVEEKVEAEVQRIARMAR